MVSWPIQQALLTAFSFIAFCLVSVPLYWHLEAWNVGCVLYIGWTAATCLINFVNGVIWRDNAINWAPVWCDITIRITWGASQGILAASLVINRRLFKIASTSSVSITRAEKRRAILSDLGIGLGIPVLHMILMWFVQGHRFNIWGGVGCLAAIPNTYFAIVMTNGVCIVMGLISGAYCIGTLRAFMKRRRQFSELIASNNNLTFNRYFRLMALATIELLATIPLSVYLLVFSLQQPIYQWRGLADIHLGFSRVLQFPAIQWLESPGAILSLTLQQWLTVSCGIVFFLFFGLAEEARTHYRLAFTSVAKKLGYTSAGLQSTGFSTGFHPSKGSKLGVTIPSFIQRSTNRRGSISSFSDKLSTAISVGDLDLFDDTKEKPYSPSSSTAGSSTCVSSPVEGRPAPTRLELPELARPDSVVDVEIVSRVRHTPDVPSPIHPSDIV
ncbi:hypothetical protein EW026_g757 [Hermanssonia centrifuga]|uniref:Pheromone receptor n=1 Tax=Hermanssonia centrifuga TaxID=98765 RepID=A0A4S4KY80_9APHY|nr:hypothetical protein EW026_g757 [Hermanssonia centrifuga]